METSQSDTTSFDVLVVGAGFAGLYLLHRMRELGLRCRVIEAAPDVGGTWYWNSYPGARCDVESIDYSYSFSPELEQEWVWTERYAGQPEILRYINHVADRFDLRRDITLDTRVSVAEFDEAAGRWVVRTDTGLELTARFCVFATGNLSVPVAPPYPGLDDFRGEWFMTQAWPRDPVDFEGRTVVVIGTGSSGVQSIPVIAKAAKQVHVLQRTPNFSIPARNRPLEAGELASVKAEYPAYRARARRMPGGVDVPMNERRASEMSPEERLAEMERRWALGGGPLFLGSFADVMTDQFANDVIAEFVRGEIRSAVEDPAVADLLTPTGYPFGAKRLCMDTDYYETFNRENVALVDISTTGIERITPDGVQLADGRRLDCDIIVFALGYDAISGALQRIDVRGRDSVTLQDEWAAGPVSHLGLMIAGFPNLFTVTGPGSPALLASLLVGIEHHVDWITACIAHVRDRGATTIEPERDAQEAWMAHVHALAEGTLFLQASNSYYLGANVPGKPRSFTLYTGGQHVYRATVDEIAESGYPGFVVDGA